MESIQRLLATEGENLPEPGALWFSRLIGFGFIGAEPA